jgi:hypothetical protein
MAVWFSEFFGGILGTALPTIVEKFSFFFYLFKKYLKYKITQIKTVYIILLVDVLWGFVVQA